MLRALSKHVAQTGGLKGSRSDDRTARYHQAIIDLCDSSTRAYLRPSPVSSPAGRQHRRPANHENVSAGGVVRTRGPLGVPAPAHVSSPVTRSSEESRAISSHASMNVDTGTVGLGPAIHAQP